MDARFYLERLVGAIDELIGSSDGVYGLHLNGDPAPWVTLTKGGEFEDWLRELEEARDHLKKTRTPESAFEQDDESDADDDWHDAWERDNFGSN